MTTKPARNVVQKIVAAHTSRPVPAAGDEIALRIDQTLTHDVQGQVVMMQLLSMDLERISTECSVQYIDHQLLQTDHRNPDDHRFLRTAAQRLGFWFSPAGNGISHPVHQERFGRPGATLLGSDSHTPSAGALGMLAIGAGATDVALVTAGEPYHLPMPAIWGVHVTGRLPDWVSAKDVILELLRRHGVQAGRNRVIEYHGAGLADLSAWDRHTIANMGTELGATSSVFPSDDTTRAFLASQGREQDWSALTADDGADYDMADEIDLSGLQPLIAMPSSPGNVVSVTEVAGRAIGQAYIGSSANPSFRDFAVVAEIVDGQRVPPQVSLDLNPGSRQVLETLIRDGHLLTLVSAGGRLHQPGCNGCAGMGQAPATDAVSLRTVPRNYAGRSGTADDKVCLVSPETAAVSALRGEITDPRTIDRPYRRMRDPQQPVINLGLLVRPLPIDEARTVEVVTGPNIVPLPPTPPMSGRIEAPVLLKLGNDVSTDEILPAGQRVLPFRSNIPRISEFTFCDTDPTYAGRAVSTRPTGGHVIVGGENYGQGSSREHAAIAPRYLGLQAVLACSFARLHRRNLINCAVLTLEFADPTDHDRIDVDDQLQLEVATQLRPGSDQPLTMTNLTKHFTFTVLTSCSPREIEILQAGGALAAAKQRMMSREVAT
jgi:aconitate hydratase